MKFLPLSQGKSAIIDDIDFEKMGRFEIEEDAARAYDKKAKELGFFNEALNFKLPS